MKKKKILFHSCWSKTQTGFGKNAKTVLSELAKTGKYEIVEYCTAPRKWDDSVCENMPWKTKGCLPNNDHEIRELYSDQNRARAVQYGAYYIDRIIKEEKPDLYIGCEDIWAFNGYWDKPWWNKFPCAIWTTLDSLPIIKPARNNADKIKNYWVWTSFAEDELKRLGYDHVKTVHGAINFDKFYPLPWDEVKELRRGSGIDDDTLVFGFVFRNQLRKLVGTLIEGFAKFKAKYPDKKAKLLLHTHWDEPQGWRITEFLEEFGVDREDVLTTYICKDCKKVQIKPYEGQGRPCPVCGSKDGQVNPGPELGCEDEDLNVIYNLMNAYIHPMTSGGLEIPILEAGLCGLPLATVPYSCGTEFTVFDKIDSLEFTEYREVVSQFRKAQPKSASVAQFMDKMSKLGKEKREKRGLAIREWMLKRFDPKITIDFLEDFIDNLPDNDYNYEFERERRDDEYPLKEIEDDFLWLKDLYKNCLRMDEDENSDGMKNWLNAIQKGVPRKEIYDFFIKTAKKENDQIEKVEIKDLFEDNGKKRLIYIMPESLGDCFISTAILRSLPKAYPLDEWDHYVCTKRNNFDMFAHIDSVKKIIPYHPQMDNYRLWEGDDVSEKVVDIAFQPYVVTQRLSSYTHNGEDIDELQLLKNGERTDYYV